MEKQHRCSIDAVEAPENGTGVQPQRTTSEDKKFKLTGETLYGGKGKRSGLTTNICDSEPCLCDHEDDHTQQELMDDTRIVEKELFAGLKQPCLLAMDTISLSSGTSAKFVAVTDRNIR
jgi:hypothetical protein